MLSELREAVAGVSEVAATAADTPLWDALLHAAALLDPAAPGGPPAAAARRILVLSDGADTSSGAAWHAAARALQDAGVMVDGLVLGRDPQVPLLGLISSGSHCSVLGVIAALGVLGVIADLGSYCGPAGFLGGSWFDRLG